jgi:hypothetical protein
VDDQGVAEGQDLEVVLDDAAGVVEFGEEDGGEEAGRADVRDEDGDVEGRSMRVVCIFFFFWLGVGLPTD